MESLLVDIAEPGNRQETQKSIVNAARTLLSADWGAMVSLNPITQQVYGPCLVATKLRERDINPVQSWLAEIARQADQNGEGYVNEFSETPDILIDGFNLIDTRSVRVITLHTKRGQKPMAILFLGFSHERRDEIQEEESLTTLMQQSSLVLENLWLLGRYRAVIEIGQNLNRQLNSYRGLFDKLREEVASIIDTSYFFMLAIHQPQSNTLDRYFSIEEGTPVVQLGMQLEGVSKAVITTGQPLKVLNLSTDQNSIVDQVDLIVNKEPTPESIIFEPLIFRGEVLGLITVQNPEPNAYDEQDIGIIKLLGNQVALALSNLRLFMYLETLNDVGQRLTENLTSEDLLKNVANEVRKATHADIVMLFPYLPAESRFGQPVYSGHLFDTESLWPTVPTKNVARLTLKLEKPIWAKDITELYEAIGENSVRREVNFEEREQIHSTAAVGLRIGNEAVGALLISYRSPQRFDVPQRQLVTGLANYAAIAIKNYRKYTALNQRRYDDLVALQKIDRQMRLTPGLKEIMRSILQGAVRHIPAADESSAILLYNQRTEELETVASIGTHRRAYENLALPIHNAKGISVWVYQNKLPVRVDNVKTAPQWRDIYYSVISDTLSEMDVPLIDEDRVIGVINFESKKEKAFTQEDQDFIVTLAGHAVLAIKNAQLYEQAEFAHKELETLHEVAQEITIQEGDPETVMQLILKRARVLLGAEMGALQLYEGILPGKVYLSEAKTATGEPIIETLEPRDNEQSVKLGIVQRVAETRRPHITRDDAVNDPHYKGSADYHSEITVPLISRSDELIGVLDLKSPRFYAFSDDDLKVLKDFARQAVIAIQYAQVYSRALSESERFRLLAEAGRDLGELTDIKQLPEAYRIILRKVSEFNDGEVIIRRFDETTQELVLEDLLNRRQTPPLRSISIGNGINGQVARERRTIVVHDRNNIPEGVTEMLGDNPRIRSLAVTPIQFQKTRYYGNLVLSHEQAHSLGPSDISLLEGLAQQLAITIHRLEMVQARMEAEQQAKDLEVVGELGQSAMEITHRLGNSLGPIKFFLADARKELEADEINRDLIKEELARIESNVLDVLRMNKGFKNRVTAVGEVVATILPVKSLLEDSSWTLSLPENIEIHWDLADDLAQVNVFPGQILDIMRHLVTNAIEAMPEGGTINIRAFNAAPYVQIEVEDNGPGIPFTNQDKIFNLFFSTKNSSGFGLWSSRRYARANGGELTVQSQPGKGSTFVLCLPISKEYPLKTSSKTPGRILIVDDEENWRRILCRTFQSAGFHADAAATTTEAWKLLTENDYQLAILDISMSAGTLSDEQGMKLLAQLDERGFLTRMKVMMLSAYGSKEQIRRAFKNHRVTDFISKDDFFDQQEEFIEKAKQILGEIQSGA